MIGSRQEHQDHDDKTVVEYVLGDLPEYAKLKHILDTYPEHMGESQTKMQAYSDALERFANFGAPAQARREFGLEAFGQLLAARNRPSDQRVDGGRFLDAERQRRIGLIVPAAQPPALVRVGGRLLVARDEQIEHLVALLDSARAAFGQVADPQLTQPITFARGDAPPMLLLTGDADTTVKPRNSKVLAKALTDRGGQAELVILPGVDHSGPVLKLAQPFARDTSVRDPVLHFLARLRQPSAPVQAAAE